MKNPIVNALLPVALCVSAALGVPETKPWVAMPGPRGIFINLGDAIAAPNNDAAVVTGYDVERGTGGHWDTIALLLKGPSSEKEFGARLLLAGASLDPVIPKPALLLDQLWKKVRRTCNLDSLGFWGGPLSVRLALGVTILDSGAQRGVSYQYRVTEVHKGGGAVVSIVSPPVAWPAAPEASVLRSRARENDEHVIRCTWSLTQGKRPVIVKVTRGEGISSDLAFYDKATLVLQGGRKDSLRFSVIDTAVTAGRVYRYALRTFDYYANPLGVSDTMVAAAFPFNRVSRPQHLEVVSNDSLSGLRLRWKLSDPANVHSVKVWRSRKWGEGYVLLIELPSTATEYVDRGIEPMVKYFYRLSITSVLGEESPQGAQVLGLYRNLHPPLPPFVAKAEGIKGGVRLLIVRTDPAINALRVFRCPGYGMPLAPVSDAIAMSGERTRYVDSSGSLDPAVTYGYAVHGENASHVLSPFSDTLFARPVIAREVKAMVFLNAKVTDGRVKLFWPDQARTIPNLRGFIVLRKPVDSTSATPVRINDSLLSANHNYYTDTTVPEGIGYEYSVVCEDLFGNRSLPSASARATIPTPKPQAPAGLRAMVTKGGVNLSWDEPVDATVRGYLVYRYERERTPEVVGKVDKGTSGLTDSLPDGAGLRFYFVTSETSKGVESAPSDEVGVRK